MMKFPIAALTAFLVLIQTFAASAQDQDAENAGTPEPEELVESLHSGLLQIMKGGDELGLEGRMEVIAPVVEQNFDVTTLGMSSIGLSVWRKWDDDQKRTYISTFRRFLTTNYASQFKSYSGQNFETVEIVDGPKRTKLVKTMLNRPSEDPVAIDYLTRERRGKIGIVDIFLDGSISEAARRRSEFSSVYKDQGFDGLITSIEGLIADLVMPDGEVPELQDTESKRPPSN